MATAYVQILFSCYREIEIADPQVYATACAAVFMHYRAEIGRAVCDPIKGLPAQLKWFPSIAEVRAECERLNEIVHASERRKVELEKQIAEAKQRDRELADLPKQARRQHGKVYDATQFNEAVANHGRPIGVFEYGREIPYCG
jgi:hypothetical protein